MDLFDTFDRISFELAKNAEPHFLYLNKSARPEIARFRPIIETWYRGYPICPDKDDVRARFRSSDNYQHYSAFFELYLYELFSKMGFKLEVHPEIPELSTHPDFLVFSGNTPLFYLEGTLCLPSVSEKVGNLFIDEILDGLNEIDSPNFWFNINWSGSPTRSISKKEIRHKLLKIISDLNVDDLFHEYDSGKHDNMPSVKLKYDNFVLKVQFNPKAPEHRGKSSFRNVGMMMGAAYCVKIDESLKNAIKGKGNKYGKLDIPLLIAVDVIDKKIISLDTFDISNALFGKQQVVLHLENHKIIDTSFDREPDGALFYYYNPMYQRISAVMFASNVTSSSFESRTPEIWHNPYPIHQLDSTLFSLPQMIPNREKAEMEKKEGREISDILCLSEQSKP